MKSKQIAWASCGCVQNLQGLCSELRAGRALVATYLKPEAARLQPIPEKEYVKPLCITFATVRVRTHPV